MNILVNYKQVNPREPIGSEVSRHIGKLNRLLRTYQPDSVQLHGSFSRHPRKVEFAFAVHLSLPTGSINATGEGPTVRLSVKHAFSELEQLIKKHRSKLRKDYEWKRKRPRALAS
jgi:ribosome-associated translation inhibitor RaiA